MLELPAIKDLTSSCDRSILADLARKATADLRDRLRAGVFVPQGDLTEWIVNDVKRRVEELLSPSLRRVINATGVVLHTNLGRAPLDPGSVARVAEIALGYTNLEFDLKTGGRGSRIDHV